MNKISAKEWMYVCAVIMFPMGTLFKGMYLLGVVMFFLSVGLIYFDPLFKRLRKQVPDADQIIIRAFITGGINAVFIYLFPFLKTILVITWCLAATFYAINIALRLEKV